MNKDKIKSSTRRTIEISNKEAVYAQLFAIIVLPGTAIFTKFAILLGATNLHFSLLSAIAQFSQIFQPLGVFITREAVSRKKIVLKLNAIGRLILCLFGIFFFLIPQGMVMQIFLVVFLISTVLLSISGNVWIAWMADTIPLNIRGRFFSKRSEYLMLAALLLGALLSISIDMFDEAHTGMISAFLKSVITLPSLFVSRNLPYLFSAIFGLAFFTSIVSLKVLAGQPERLKEREHERFTDMIKIPLMDKNFRRLLIYGLWWMLAVGIGSPFWTPFMLGKLKMSLIEVQTYGAINTIFSLISLRTWGSIIDRFGNKPAMALCIILGGLNPMVWLFVSPERYWFIYVEGITSGTMWAGTGIIATNFVLSIAPEDKRQIYSGVFGALSGVGLMFTMLLSGILMPPQLKIFGLDLHPEQVLFGLTGIARWSTAIPLSFIYEDRAKPLGFALEYISQSTMLIIGQVYDRVLFRKKRK